MKTKFWICTAVAAALVLAVGCGLADTSGSTSYYTWTANDTSATVTGYTGTAKTLAIPGKLNGKPVTAIGDGAFAGLDAITSGTLPSTVTTIGAEAFSGCVSLRSCNIPSVTVSIGDAAFANCVVLASVKIPASVRSIPLKRIRIS